MRKNLKYNKQMANKFFEYSSKGLFPSQIAPRLGVLTTTIFKWSKDKFKPEFITAYMRGIEACKSYHEDLLQTMINDKEGTYSNIQVNAQIFLLKVRFKEEWSEKQEAKIEISTYDKMDDKKLNEVIMQLLNKPSNRKLLNLSKNDSNQPKLRIVGDTTDINTDLSNSNEDNI